MPKFKNHLISDGVSKIKGLPAASATGEAYEHDQAVAALATKQDTLAAGDHIDIGSTADVAITITSNDGAVSDGDLLGTSSGSTWGRIDINNFPNIRFSESFVVGETYEFTDGDGDVWGFELDSIAGGGGSTQSYIQLVPASEPTLNGQLSGGAANHLQDFTDISGTWDGSGNIDKVGDADGISVNTTDFVMQTEKGAVNGVATLDGAGLVPAAQLPSYVDDVLEYADEASFPGTGETGKIYIAIDTGDVYRWSGSVYVKISDVLSAADVLSLWESESGRDASVDGAKLDAIEAGATGDQTDAEILAAFETETGRDVSVDGAKLDAIEAGATADQTDAEILAAFEAETGRDVSVDGSKLDGIESGATADQTDAEILAAFEAESGRDVSVDGAKLDGIEAGAALQDASEVAVNDVADNFTATDVEGVLAELYDTATTGIGPDTITQSMMTDDSVGTDELIDGDVTTDKLADANVTEAKLEAALAAKINASVNRYEATSLTLVADTPLTINHALGHKYVTGLGVYDSNDEPVLVDVVMVDANNLTIEATSGMTGVTVAVSA